MTLETRLHDYLVSQANAVPPMPDKLDVITARGHRRIVWRRTVVGLATATALVMLVTASVVIFAADSAQVAASPLTGQDLTMIHDDPVVLRGQLGPEPETQPVGIDLTFSPIDTPTANDLEAIDQVIEQEQYTSPIVVALGEITAARTHVYVIHDLDPDTRTGRSTVVAVGPDYPEFHAVGGSTERGTWEMSANRDPEGNGWVAMRVHDFASYVQVDAAGSISWQRPSDGFIWIPFTAPLDEPVVVTGHDPTGRTYLEQTLGARQLIAKTQAEIAALEAEIARILAAISAGSATSDDEALLPGLRDALEAAHERLAALLGNN